jgi:hypothetical protein
MPADRKKTNSAPSRLLDSLNDEQAGAVFRLLLDRHPDLRRETEEIASNLISSQSIEEIAASVLGALISVDLEALNGRAGKHSWGYVEPSEAAWELLNEALEEWVESMDRHMQCDLMIAAETLCIGLISGLYQAHNTDSDGALGWAPDFPMETAGDVLQQFLELTRKKSTGAEKQKLLERLISCAPKWTDMLQRVLSRRIGGMNVSEGCEGS